MPVFYFRQPPQPTPEVTVHHKDDRILNFNSVDWWVRILLMAILFAIVLFGTVSLARGQTGGSPQSVGLYYWNGTKYVPVNSSNPLPVSVSGGGSNACASATGSAVPASACWGGLNIGGNLAGWTGFGLTDSNAAAVAIVNANGDQITTFPISAASLPLPTGAASSADQTNGSQQTQIVDGSGNVIGSTSNRLNVNGLVAVNPSSSSTQAVSACNILSTASTNATNCKGSAGNFYGFDVYNTTTTVYYLRLYNTSSSPTCSSATGFIRTVPVPPGATSGLVGGIVENQSFPTNYSTGISYCITGGSSSTDNTNAAAGIFGEIRYE